jgi:exoribonuclease II
MMGEVDPADDEWTANQIKREKRSLKQIEKKKKAGTISKKIRFALPYYCYTDKETKTLTILFFEEVSDWLEKMTSASSSLDQIVKRISAFLWFTTDGKGVSADGLYEIVIDDDHRNKWYDRTIF